MAGSLSHHIRNICVFGGSSPGKEKEFLESANHLGQVLAERKIHLVYGEAALGYRGVSIAVFLGGSQVLGVVPKALAKGSIIGKIIGEELQVPSLLYQVVWAHWKRSFIFPLRPNCTFTINP